MAAAAASAEEGQVIGCHTRADFEETKKKGLENGKLVVIDFTASWCGPCRFIAPILAEIAKKNPLIVFLKVDVDELKEVAAHYKVEAMPTFLFMKLVDGEEKTVDKVVGARKEDLLAKIELHNSAVPVTAAA